MKKQDLKDGMILELRNGFRYLLTNGTMRSLDGFMELVDYSEDLRLIDCQVLDIVKVYEDTGMLSLQNIFKDRHLTLIWERKEIKLTDREIEVLKALKVVWAEWLARDRSGKLFAYEDKPEKLLSTSWWSDGHYCFTKKDESLFNFIKWTDNEPTKIDDLLKGI